MLVAVIVALSACNADDDAKEHVEQSRKWERKFEMLDNLYPQEKPGGKPADVEPHAVMDDTEISLKDLDLILRKLELENGDGNSAAIFFAETEVTNRAFAEFLRETMQTRDDSALEFAEKERRELRFGSTATSAVKIEDPSSLWRKGVIPKDRDDHPVSFIKMDHAQQFCGWLNSRYKLAGTFRLPTEKEWLFAAYGKERLYPWGDEQRDYTSRSTEPVRARPELKTPDGLYGMWGNVSELVLSDSDGYSGKVKDVNSPRITKWLGESFMIKEVRGKPVGPRQDYWGYTHSPRSRSDTWGFRIVFVPKE